jgi:hypothetical protein
MEKPTTQKPAEKRAARSQRPASAVLQEVYAEIARRG